MMQVPKKLYLCDKKEAISNPFYEQLHHRLTYTNNLVFHSQPMFHLTDEQYQCFCYGAKLLKTGDIETTYFG